MRPIQSVDSLLSSYSLLLISDTEGEGFWRFASFPSGSAFQRLNRPRFIKVQHDIELLGHRGIEIMTDALALRQIDHAYRPLQPLLPQSFRCRAAVPQAKHEA